MRVMLAGGGTGGHLNPGLALAAELQRLRPESRFLFVGTPDGLERELVPAAGYELRLIGAGRGSPLNWRKPGNLPRFLLALVQSWRLQNWFKPDLVVALGGYAAAAPGLVAGWRGVPLAVLEQNTVPGRVSRLLGRHAGRIYLQFEEAAPYFGAAAGRTRPLGSPVRDAFIEMAARPPCTGPALLATGGSQGAEKLNELLIAAAGRLRQMADVEIIHVAGAANVDRVRAGYAAAGVSAEVHGYARLEDLYPRCRLTLGRAGAGTIAELAVAGVPGVLLPLPSAMDDHQRRNAAVAAAAGAVVALEESRTTPEQLAEVLAGLWRDEPRRARMAQAARALARPSAGAQIARDLLALAKP